MNLLEDVKNSGVTDLGRLTTARLPLQSREQWVPIESHVYRAVLHQRVSTIVSSFVLWQTVQSFVDALPDDPSQFVYRQYPRLRLHRQDDGAYGCTAD
jgi:hypothetical protein